MALVFMFIFAFGTLLFYHIFLCLFNKKELKKEKERKNFLLNNIRYKISHKNGLIENYCDENNIFYTLNGKIITDFDNFKTVFCAENFFIISRKKYYEEYEDGYDVEGDPMRYMKYYVLYILNVFDYNGNILFNDKIMYEERKDNFEYRRDLNDEYTIFATKYLYSNKSGSIKRIENDESINVNSSGTIDITLGNGSLVKLNNKLEVMA